MRGVFKKDEQGFTLVEVLIALFIFSLISVGATSALTSSLRGQSQMQDKLEDISELENMRALIRSDMASLILQPRREPYGNNELYVLDAGGEALLDFSRTGRSNPMGEPRGDLQRIAYLFEDGKFIRRSYAQFNPAPQSKYIDRILLEGVAKAELGFESFVSDMGMNLIMAEIQIEPGKPSTFLQSLKLDLEFENGDTLTQYFELGL